MGHEVYVIQKHSTTLLLFSNLTQDRVKVTEKAPRMHDTDSPTFLNFQDQALFVIGGMDWNARQDCAFVECYSLETDSWAQAPELL